MKYNPTMRIFISWSGASSKAVALSLQDWLPNVIQRVSPYVSADSIDAGERWAQSISTELEAANFGILCVTKQNVDAPWVCFEAGALAKQVSDPKNRVIPLLLGDMRPSDIPQGSPLLHFQAVGSRESDLAKVINSINSAMDESLPEKKLDAAFEKWWPDLESTLSVTEEATSSEVKDPRDEMLAEILELTRSLHRDRGAPKTKSYFVRREYVATALARLSGLEAELDSIEHAVTEEGDADTFTISIDGARDEASEIRSALEELLADFDTSEGALINELIRRQKLRFRPERHRNQS